VRCTLVYFVFGENAFKGERFMCKIRAWTVGFFLLPFYLSWPKKRELSYGKKREHELIKQSVPENWA
jgi:hypothetical protein